MASAPNRSSINCSICGSQLGTIECGFDFSEKSIENKNILCNSNSCSKTYDEFERRPKKLGLKY